MPRRRLVSAAAAALFAIYLVLVGINHVRIPKLSGRQQQGGRAFSTDTRREDSNVRFNVTRRKTAAPQQKPCAAARASSLLLTSALTNEVTSPMCGSCGSCVVRKKMAPMIMCTPSFIIIGAAKAGTSSIYHWLTTHPNILPADRKEQHYWTFRFSAKSSKIQRYLGNFSSAARHYQNRTCENDDASSAAITGEATPDMHYYPLAPYRLRHFMPDVKIIFLVRPPFELAWSLFNFNRGKLRSRKNEKRFKALSRLRSALEGTEYAAASLELIDRGAGGGGDGTGSSKNEHQIPTFTFDTWLNLFSFEIEACLLCHRRRDEHSTVRRPPECLQIPQLNAKAPTLFRWHDDVLSIAEGEEKALSIGGKLIGEEQCWFPPTTHHLNFFGRTAFDRQLRLYRSFFKRDDQILVVDSKAMFSDPQSNLDRVVEFLGLPAFKFLDETLGIKLQGPLRPGDMTATHEAATIRQARTPTDHTAATIQQRLHFEALQQRLSAIADRQTAGGETNTKI